MPGLGNAHARWNGRDGLTLVIRSRRILVNPDGTLIDGYVLVAGDTIRDVAEGAPPGESGGASYIDAEHRTVLPGLIDAHVHLAGVGDDTAGQATPPQVARDTVTTLQRLAQIVQSGVTTIRDCGYPHHGVFAIRELLSQPGPVAPRMILCGRGITVTGGHGRSVSVAADGPDAIRGAIRTELQAGADWIKLMITGGTSTKGERVSDVHMSKAEVEAAVDEAHRHGKRIAAHCSNAEGTAMALSAGVDSIEHGIAISDAHAALMARDNVSLCPTLSSTHAEAEPDRAGVPEHVRAKAIEIVTMQRESFRRALANGVRIVAGTDGGPDYLPLGAGSLIEELGLLVELGMSPLEAINSATSQAAAMLGLGEHLGSVQPGLAADLLIIDGDPLRDLNVLHKVWAVVAGGDPVCSRSNGSEVRCVKPL